MFNFVSLSYELGAYIRAAIRLANRVSFWEFVTRQAPVVQQSCSAALVQIARIAQTDYG